MPSIINATTGPVGGIVSSADGSGELLLQTGGNTAIQIAPTRAVSMTSSLSVAGPITSEGNVLAPPTLAAAVSATGTSVDFTGIPSWAKRVTVMFSGVSTNGASPIQVQLGAGSVETSGYTSGIGGVANAAATSYVTSTSGFLCTVGIAAANATSGQITISALGSNAWVYNGVMSSTSNINSIGGGAKTLSGTLDRIRIIASNTGSPADTFDAGTINIMWE